MANHRIHSIEFKRQLVAEYAAGDTLQGLATWHDVGRSLTRLWVAEVDAGAVDGEVGVHGAVEQHGRGHAGQAEGAGENRGLPVSVRHRQPATPSSD